MFFDEINGQEWTQHTHTQQRVRERENVLQNTKKCRLCLGMTKLPGGGEGDKYQ